jgi:hypothetical protein
LLDNGPDSETRSRVNTHIRDRYHWNENLNSCFTGNEYASGCGIEIGGALYQSAKYSLKEDSSEVSVQERDSSVPVQRVSSEVTVPEQIQRQLQLRSRIQDSCLCVIDLYSE